MTAPAHEWPTRTTGPSAFRIARLVAATSLSSESSGFWTATTLSPAFSRYGMTFCQHDPSANAPWTRTAVLAFSWAAEAGRPIVAIAVRRRHKPITPLHDFMATLLHLVGTGVAVVVISTKQSSATNEKALFTTWSSEVSSRSAFGAGCGSIATRATQRQVRPCRLYRRSGSKFRASTASP